MRSVDLAHETDPMDPSVMQDKEQHSRWTREAYTGIYDMSWWHTLQVASCSRRIGCSRAEKKTAKAGTDSTFRAVEYVCSKSSIKFHGCGHMLDEVGSCGLEFDV